MRVAPPVRDNTGSTSTAERFLWGEEDPNKTGDIYILPER